MSLFPSNDSRALGLRALAREAAGTEPAAVDWNRVEKRLWGAIRSRGGAPVRASPARIVWAGLGGMAIGAAAAAAVIFVVGGGRIASDNAAARHPSTAVALPGAGEKGIRDASQLRPGDVTLATEAPIAYRHDGIATWELAPGSRFELRSLAGADAGSTTVALLEGSLHAEVLVHDRAEVFAVEVSRTRIAVHGTSFTVTRLDERAIVDVQQGSVVVEPVDHAQGARGWLMTGPRKASFSLDGGGDVQWLGPSPEQSAAAQAASERPARFRKGPEAQAAPADEARPAPDQPSPQPSVAPPKERGQQDLAAGTQAIKSGLVACYERQTSGPGAVEFSIETSLTIVVSPDGAIQQGVFTPPLSPSLMSCAGEVISRVRFASAEQPTKIQIPIHLARGTGR